MYVVFKILKECVVECRMDWANQDNNINNLNEILRGSSGAAPAIFFGLKFKLF
jgi:hypothetical protein